MSNRGRSDHLPPGILTVNEVRAQMGLKPIQTIRPNQSGILGQSASFVVLDEMTNIDPNLYQTIDASPKIRFIEEEDTSETDNLDLSEELGVAKRIPTIGLTVFYRLTEQNAHDINRRRSHAREHLAMHRTQEYGTQIHWGDDVLPGDILPMIIVKTWGKEWDSPINGQVFLDGNDTFWATSVKPGEESGEWRWAPPDSDT